MTITFAPDMGLHRNQYTTCVAENLETTQMSLKGCMKEQMVVCPYSKMSESYTTSIKPNY